VYVTYLTHIAYVEGVGKYDVRIRDMTVHKQGSMVLQSAIGGGWCKPQDWLTNVCRQAKLKLELICFIFTPMTYVPLNSIVVLWYSGRFPKKK